MCNLLKLMTQQSYACIYCTNTKDKNQFNREHVIPKAFGTFGVDTLVLNNLVCQECNQSLGNSVDRVFAQKSLEGVQRFNFGLKPTKDYDSNKYGKEHIITISEGMLKGLACKKRVDTATNNLILIPKKDDIGCRKVNGEYDFYSLKDIPSKEFFDAAYSLHTDRIIIFSCSVDHNKIIEVIKKKYGSNVQHIVYDDTSERNCITECEFTSDLQRALAKIAFNYLAYNNKGNNIIFQKCFNPIRKFILDGTKPYYPVIERNNNSILSEKNNQAILAHIITIYYSPNDRSLMVSLAINNYIHYKICLTPTYNSDLTIETHYGHYFDFHNKKIGKIEATNILQPSTFSLILKPYPSGLLI